MTEKKAYEVTALKTVVLKTVVMACNEAEAIALAQGETMQQVETSGIVDNWEAYENGKGWY